MVIDAWLLEQHRLGIHPPSLRFYRWSPPAISLGYHQRRYPDFWQDLTWQGQPIDLVRRPTGGRAVLHDGDLTYSVVTSGLTGNVNQVYERICQFLIEGWRSLGVELHYGLAGRSYFNSANCFATATNADLVDSWGHKFIGSAQLQQDSCILQQGSLLLDRNPDLFEKVFGTPAPDKVALPPECSIDVIVETLKDSASQCFDCDFISRPLGVEEWQAIENWQKNYLDKNVVPCSSP
jgi:lipoate-protein ligase A